MKHLVRLCAIALLISGAAIGLCQEISLPQEVLERQAKVPDAVRYRILFHHAAAFKDRADELERQGKSGAAYRNHLAHKLNLTPEQVMTLNMVALQYRSDVADIERQLNESVTRFLQQNSHLAAGEPVPPPPNEAHYLLAKRDEITLTAKERLHASLGDGEFTRIDSLVKQAYSPISRPTLSTPGPNWNAGRGEVDAHDR